MEDNRGIPEHIHEAVASMNAIVTLARQESLAARGFDNDPKSPTYRPLTDLCDLRDKTLPA